MSAETHDTDYYLNPAAKRPEEVDPFARPQARLDVLILKQVDPDGKAVGMAGHLQLVARNAAPAVRLEYQPGTAVYESSFIALLDPKSRYAVRIISPPPSFWSPRRRGWPPHLYPAPAPQLARHAPRLRPHPS
ncbi:MAG: hypothetical protein U0793_06115 [Gemmataceae bacterium]